MSSGAAPASSRESGRAVPKVPPEPARTPGWRQACVLGWLLLTAAAPASGRGGVVASAHPAASEAGVELLRAGGHAIDAAAAVAYALSVVEPYSAGIGGGGFLLYRDAKSGEVHVLDYREVAPRAAHRDLYLVDGRVDATASVRGARAVAVPGMVQGFAEAQRRFGKKDLKAVLAPAIRLARDGVLVLPVFHEESVEHLETLRAHPEAARVFLRDGEPYEVGERLRQPDLARTLERLAAEGPELFTRGEVAQAIVAELTRLGGIITLEDLAGFTPRWRAPLVGRYRGREIYTMPPPSSGGTHVLQILGLLELDREKRGRKPHWLDADDVHVLAEAMRSAFADRATHLGDPAFHRVPVPALYSPSYLAERYRELDVARARTSTLVAAGRPEPADTTHFTIIDREGNVVSCTQTINYTWGAMVVAPGTGVVLNDEMDDFAAAPGVPNSYGLVGGEANSIQPGKIPLSSMSPTLVVEDGRLRLAVGAPGGATIITTVVQAILQILDYGVGIETALSTPRVHHQWLPDKLRYEVGALTEEMIAALKAKGHVLEPRETTWGDATGIEVRADGTRVGYADPRGDGVAIAE